MTSEALGYETAALRLPPHSIEAEQSLIGGLLLDNDAWERVADIVAAEDFYRDDHRRIFRHITALIQQGKPADIVTVHESLQKSGEDEAAGGIAYLAELANQTPSAANVRRYAEIIRERAILRKLISVADEIAASALAPMGRDAKTILDEAEAKIFEIAEAGARAVTGFVSIGTALKQVVDRVQELYDRNASNDVTGVPTGYLDLDEKTAGLQPSDLIIVAGRPAMGKTTFALNIAEHVALHQKLPVAIFSMEMPATQLAMRFLASVGRIDLQKLRRGKLTDDDWARLSAAMGKLYDAPIFIDETGGLNPIDLRARARRLARQFGGRLGLVVIDYLQLMVGAKESDNRANELSEISRSVKTLAKELNTPIIALSQLNRSLEQRPNKRPVMSDLRESGAIEQDADVVMFLHREKHFDKKDGGDEEQRAADITAEPAELIIGKQRNGPIGTIDLVFFRQTATYHNLHHQFNDGDSPGY